MIQNLNPLLIAAHQIFLRLVPLQRRLMFFEFLHFLVVLHIDLFEVIGTRQQQFEIIYYLDNNLVSD